jgi:methylenetetrahydrofolate dehydrogenase (NADP+)/methenyltetrahydrofolate cyclohydrolase
VLATHIDGKAIAGRIRDGVARRARALRHGGHPPCLAAILAGDDAAALSYARSQEARAEEAGIDYRLVRLPSDVGSSPLIDEIDALNADASISGIMLHLPLPRGDDAFSVQQRIAAAKDVEGVGAENLGLLMMGRDALVPCTAAAAFECLRSVVPDMTGLDAVVVGRSVIVGKPLAMLLLAANATVTQCHSRTRDLREHTRSAKLLVVAAGSAGLIGAEHVSPGAVVVDVGTHRVTVLDADGVERIRTVGDVRFDEVASIAAAITPVPGGVGPVTVAKLLENTVRACERMLAAP